MVLEAVMICVDNSSYMRNGDYRPTRLEAQNEAVNYLASMKTQSNPESTVGLLATAGKRVEVLLSLDRELGKMMNALHKVAPGGVADLASSLKTAQLVLKNRQNKSQKQRIILFVGSPVVQDQKAIVRVAKNLKKNNVAVDVINFGSENINNDNQSKLEAFVKAVNSGDNSKLVTVPPGPHILSDMIVAQIMSDAPAGGAVNLGGAGAGGVGQFGDVDAQNDPELALALRMSMEEERERQQREAQANRRDGEAEQEQPAADQQAPAEPQAEVVEPEPAAEPVADEEMLDDDDDEDEDTLLERALALSMEAEAEKADAQMQDASSDAVADSLEADDAMEVDAAAFADPDFIEGLIDSLPGVNKDEIDIADLLDEVTGDDDSKDKKSKKDDSSGSS